MSATDDMRATSKSRARIAAAVVSGVLFGVGLALSGMTMPTKVIGFLDFLGGWDPSLALVMVGAIAVHMAVYRMVKGRATPLLDVKWSLPSRRDVDLRLVAGAALFGVGWGLGGFCPGPGVTSLVSGSAASLVFVGAMLVGMFVTGKLEERAAARASGAPAAAPSS